MLLRPPLSPLLFSHPPTPCRAATLKQNGGGALHLNGDGSLSGDGVGVAGGTGSVGSAGRRKVHRMLEKGRANLSRSKSELGEQHKRMVSHLSRGRAEITEQNRKLLASISSMRSKKFGGGGGRGSASTSPTPPLPPSAAVVGRSVSESTADFSPAVHPPPYQAGRTLSAPAASEVSGGGRMTTSSYVRCYNSATVTRRDLVSASSSITDRSTTPLRDLDSVLMDLGIDPAFGGGRGEQHQDDDGSSTLLRNNNGFEDNGTDTLPCDSNRLSCLPRLSNSSKQHQRQQRPSPPPPSTPQHLHKKKLHNYHLQQQQPKQQQPADNLYLERQLVEGYGEFEFIDDKDQTLTRRVLPPEEETKRNRGSTNGLANEIFGELRSQAIKVDNNPTGTTGDNEDDDEDASGSSFYNSTLVQRSLAILGAGVDNIEHHQNGFSSSSPPLAASSHLNLNGNSTDVGPPPPPAYNRRPLSGGFRGSAASGLENHVSSFYATTARKSRIRRKRERRLSSTSFSGSYESSFEEQNQHPWLSSNSSIAAAAAVTSSEAVAGGDRDGEQFDRYPSTSTC